MRVNTVITRLEQGHDIPVEIVAQAHAKAQDSIKVMILGKHLARLTGVESITPTPEPAPEPTIEDAVAAAEKAAAQALRSLAWNARIASRDDATWKAYLSAVRKDDRAMANRLAKARKDMTGAQLTYDAALAATGGVRAKAAA